MADHTYEIAFALAGKINNTLKSSFGEAAKSVFSFTKQIEENKKAIAGIENLRGMQGSLSQLGQTYKAQMEALKALKAETSAFGPPTQQQIQNQKKLAAIVQKTGAEFNALRAKVGTAAKELGVANRSAAEISSTLSRLQTKTKCFEMMASGSRMFKNNLAELTLASVKAQEGVRNIAVTGMDFDTAMSKVAAVSRASGEDFEKLRNQAKDLGSSTSWSASQAAEGMQFLAMAGFKTEEVLKAMPGMLSLASAGAVDLGTAADIASNILTGFGLKAEDMGRLGDTLVNAFTGSNVNLQMLGETMKFVAPVAKSMGVSVEEAAAMAGKLGDAGIQGSMAGTNLRTVLLRLAKPTSEGAKALQTLGVSVADSSGNMRNYTEILKDLDKATAGLSQTEKTAYMKAIFDTEALSGAMVLMEQAGSGALNSFTEALKRQGSAAEVAGTQNNNFGGDVKQLQSAYEGLTLQIWKEVEPAFRTVAQSLTSVIQTIQGFLKENPLLTKSLFVIGSVLAAVVTTFTGAIMTFKTGLVIFGALKVAAGGLGLAVGAVSAPVAGVVAAIAGLVAAGVWLYSNWDTVKAKALELGSAIWSGLGSCVDWVAQAFSGAFSFVEGLVSGIWNRVTSLFSGIGSVISNIQNIAGGIFKKLFGKNETVQGPTVETSVSGQGSEQATSWADSITSSLSGVSSTLESQLSGIWTTLNGSISSSLEAAQKLAGEKWESLGKTLSTAGGFLKTTAKGVWTSVTNLFGFSGAEDKATPAFQKLIGGWKSLFSEQNLSSIGKCVGDIFSKENTDKWTAQAQTALNGLSSALGSFKEGNWGEGWKKLTTTASASFDGLKATFGDIGKLIDQKLPGFSKAFAGFTFPDSLSKAWSGLQDTFGKSADGFSAFAKQKWDSVKKFFGSDDKAEGQGPSFFQKLTQGWKTAFSKENLESIGKGIQNVFSSENVSKWTASANTAFSGLSGALDQFKNGNWSAGWAQLSSTAGTSVQALQGILGDIGKLMDQQFPGFSKTIDGFKNSFMNIFSGVIEALQPVINSIQGMFEGLTTFVSGVFSGNWKAAWDGAVQLFSNAWQGLGALVKLPINAIISLVNKCLENLNGLKLDIPSWVPGLGGKTFGIDIPPIPMLAEGGIATSAIPAIIGEGREPEAVLPLSKLSDFLGLQPSQSVSSTHSVTVNMSVNVQGTGSNAGEDVRSAIGQAGRDLKRELEQLLRNERRLSYT